MFVDGPGVQGAEGHSVYFATDLGSDPMVVVTISNAEGFVHVEYN